ncbi:hypothetical protein ASPZODRAFT_146000 [Penicilliopsis zonata CBS 506.65]|uniref:F-box domain-containing protein n=1 Tax=Penicilliopsis zonata CBS 506.65 TaxID=1073090 RepID=A0A1L9S923_9EURO|nr:hypothetical protein ASPZODRAFT_146000 [Penicilliopsis zonata CBS 506.65]OJJ43655.1 hypothetical protein ASPZODRAFT_146000 [Penicilliopsis zonata CBS 506.65]
MASKALQIPELVHQILSHVDDKKSLSAAIRVNSTFFNMGLAFLWKAVPTKALLHVQPDRRHIYAANLRVIRTGPRDEGVIAELNQISFPKLKEVHIALPDIAIETIQSFQNLLPPTLTAFVFKGKSISLEVWEHLAINCPLLKLLVVDSETPGIEATDLLRLLRQCQSMEGLVLDGGMAKALDRDLLLYLARSMTKAVRLTPPDWLHGDDELTRRYVVLHGNEPNAEDQSVMVYYVNKCAALEMAKRAALAMSRT